MADRLRRWGPCLVLGLGLVASPARGSEYLNLDFEIATRRGDARGWFQGGRGYETIVDSTTAVSGERSLRIRRLEVGDFGVATATFPAAAAAGKRIRYSAAIKTEGVTGGWAGLWLRALGPDGVLAFANMEGEGPSGTTPWTRYSFEIDVGAEAHSVTFGALLEGTGTAWFDDLAFTLDGKPYEQVRPVPFTPSPAEIEWLLRHATPLQEEGPPSDREREALAEVVGDARIVALGANTHGTSEFFRLRGRLTRILAEELGFTVVAIEANMPEVERINEYVLGGEIDPREALAGTYLWSWSTEEMLEFVEWMREYNRSGGHLEIRGFDMQFPHRAMDEVEAFLALSEPEYGDRVARSYDQVRLAYRSLRARQREDVNYAAVWRDAAKLVLANLELNRQHYLQGADARTVERAIQNARIVVQGAEALLREETPRERSLAENATWILEQEGPSAKMVVWAHNDRVSRAPKSHPSLGGYLALARSDLVAVGFTFRDGEYTARSENGIGPFGTSTAGPGSVEWALSRLDWPAAILDVRGAARGEAGRWLTRQVDLRNIGATPRDDAFDSIVVAEEFDALVYTETSHPTRVLDTPRPIPGQ